MALASEVAFGRLTEFRSFPFIIAEFGRKQNNVASPSDSYCGAYFRERKLRTSSSVTPPGPRCLCIFVGDHHHLNVVLARPWRRHHHHHRRLRLHHFASHPSPANRSSRSVWILCAGHLRNPGHLLRDHGRVRTHQMQHFTPRRRSLLLILIPRCMTSRHFRTRARRGLSGVIL